MSLDPNHGSIKIICSNSPADLFGAFQNDLKDFIKNGGNNFLVITPNITCNDEIINSFFKEHTLRKSFLKSNFTTFKNVCREITRELAPEKIVLSGTSCKEILKEIVSKCKEELAFGSLNDYQGLYDNLFELIIRFKQNGYKNNLHSASNKVFQAKDVSLDSFLNVYNKYNEYLNEKDFFDEADEIIFTRKIFARKIFAKGKTLSSKMMSGWEKLFVAGFTSLSLHEESLFENLSGLFKESNLYMLYDKSDIYQSRYFHLNGIVSRLFKTPGAKSIFLKEEAEDGGYKNNLDYVKENIFISYKEKEDLSFTDKSVNIINAFDLKDEADFCAAEIRSLLDKKKYRPGDIAVIVRNKDKYANEISMAFKKYSINADMKRQLPAIKFGVIKSAMLPLYMVSRDFLRDDVISFLSSGYINIQSDIDLDKAEIALMKAGIISGAKNYNMKLGNLEKALRDNNEKDADFIAHVRNFTQKFIDYITANIKTKDTVSNYKRTLINVLEKTYKIKEQIVKNLKDTAPELVKRDIAAYYELFNAFDEIITAFRFAGKENDNIHITSLINLISNHLSAKNIPIDESISFITDAMPADGDVHLLTPEEFSAGGCKVVFALNMIDGVFPKKPLTSFLLGSGQDDFTFLPKKEDVLNDEKLLFYKMISLCKERLYITYCKEGGDELLSGVRSAFVDDIALLIEGSGDERSIERKAAAFFDENGGKAICKEDFLLDFFSTITTNITDNKKEVFDFLVSTDEERELFKRIFGNVLIEYEREKSDRFTVYEGNLVDEDCLLREKLKEKIEKNVFSVSQLDTFANCPINYFFNRILALLPIELPDVSLQAKIRGTILHNILFRYFSTANISTVNISSANIFQLNIFSKEVILSETERIEKLAKDYFDKNANLYSMTNPHVMEIEKENIINTLKKVVEYELTQRNAALLKLEKAKEQYQKALEKSEESRMKKITPKYLIQAEKKLKSAKKNQFLFKPAYFEHGFGIKKSKMVKERLADHIFDEMPLCLNLSNGKKDDSSRIFVRGYIDRIDINDEETGFFIIDYKSGLKPSEKDIKEGRSFQLPIYAEYVKKALLKGAKPQGGVYYMLNPPPRRCKPITVSFEEVKPFLVKYIEMMKKGEYFVMPNKECKSYCDFSCICRYDKSLAEKKVKNGDKQVSKK